MAEGVSVHHAVTQIIPQTRHYVHRRLIFDKFEYIYFKIMMLSRETMMLTVGKKIELSYFRENYFARIYDACKLAVGNQFELSYFRENGLCLATSSW